MTEVVPDVYQVSTLGAGVTVLRDGDRIVLLDAGLRSTPSIVLDFLTTKRLKPGAVSHILVTHYHPDHIGGLARLQRATGALVGSHTVEAPYITGQRLLPNPVTSRALQGFFTAIAPLLSNKPVAVDLLLKDGEHLDLMGGLDVIHTPGHTAGSLSFFLPARGVLFVGDALQRWRERLSLPNALFTQDMAQAKASIRRLAELDVETLCFSHFPPILKRAQTELRQLVDRVS